MSFKTCVHFLLLQDIEEDILNKFGNQTVLVPIDFHLMEQKNTIEVNGH